MLNPSGNVQRCNPSANVLCEKSLIKNAKMCLNVTGLDAKITSNASTTIR
jgi:hypothetical protein